MHWSCPYGTVHEFGSKEYTDLIPPERRNTGSRSVIMVDVYQANSVCQLSLVLPLRIPTLVGSLMDIRYLFIPIKENETSSANTSTTESRKTTKRKPVQKTHDCVRQKTVSRNTGGKKCQKSLRAPWPFPCPERFVSFELPQCKCVDEVRLSAK